MEQTFNRDLGQTHPGKNIDEEVLGVHPLKESLLESDTRLPSFPEQ